MYLIPFLLLLIIQIKKDWYNLPRELREVLTKFTGSTSEAGISRDDETKTHRDQDQSLAANNPTTEDEQSEGFRKDEKKGYSDEFKEGGMTQQSAKKKKKKGKKCVSCGKIHKGKKGKLSEFLGRFADKNPNDLIGSINAGTIEGQQKIQAGESVDKPTKIKNPKTASDVEHGAYGAISTETPLDVSDDTGYEERPHLCAECVGNLPREDAKGHHDKEIEDKKSPAKVKEPHVVEGETSHPKEKAEEHGLVCDKCGETIDESKFNTHYATHKEKEKSEQFKKIYGGGKKRKKGVPEWNVNTWGLDYTVKEYEE